MQLAEARHSLASRHRGDDAFAVPQAGRWNPSSGVSDGTPRKIHSTQEARNQWLTPLLNHVARGLQ